MKVVYLVIKLIVLAFFLILALMNTHFVDFVYFPGEVLSWPLIAVLFMSFVIGAIFGVLAMFGRVLRLRSENHHLKTECQKATRLAEQAVEHQQADTLTQQNKA